LRLCVLYDEGGNFVRLCSDGNIHTTTAAVETDLTRDVANVSDGFANYVRNLDVTIVNGDFSRYLHEASSDEGLNRNTCDIAFREKSIEQCIRNLIANLVGVTLGY
jgi:hypothetical protein